MKGQEIKPRMEMKYFKSMFRKKKVVRKRNPMRFKKFAMKRLFGGNKRVDAYSMIVSYITV